MEIAARAAVDLCEVSLPLLVKRTSQHAEVSRDVVDAFLAAGPRMGYIRAPRRVHIDVPEIPPRSIRLPPAGSCAGAHAPLREQGLRATVTLIWWYHCPLRAPLRRVSNRIVGIWRLPVNNPSGAVGSAQWGEDPMVRLSWRARRRVTLTHRRVWRLSPAAFSTISRCSELDPTRHPPRSHGQRGG